MEFERDAEPSIEELNTAIKQLSSGKAPGPDCLPPEIFKLLDRHALQRLLELFKTIWCCRHDLLSTSVAGEVQGAKHGLVHGVR